METQDSRDDESIGLERDLNPNHKEVTIIINGTPTKVEKGRYSYEQLYALAFPGRPLPSGAEQPITYKFLHGHQEGVLLPGEAIEIHEGMVFNVEPTFKS
jgi:hypothetical protein